MAAIRESERPAAASSRSQASRDDQGSRLGCGFASPRIPAAAHLTQEATAELLLEAATDIEVAAATVPSVQCDPSRGLASSQVKAMPSQPAVSTSQPSFLRRLGAKIGKAIPSRSLERLEEATGYLPEYLNAKRVLKPVSESSSTFFLDNGTLQAPTLGLGYRKSRNLEDVYEDDSDFAVWGSTVQGKLANGWLETSFKKVKTPRITAVGGAAAASPVTSPEAAEAPALQLSKI
eukprot:TRINITY_DN38882_c0_g2_i1.p1 TRINITY_DN38882_c0_g2~~TRINITY_DN38882_c0_g2_i1.p1  ORF type:complete len:273 (+),score=51.99 TRINITY_DN38882_c0_g2_i1:119-820(+)